VGSENIAVNAGHYLLLECLRTGEQKDLHSQNAWRFLIQARTLLGKLGLDWLKNAKGTIGAWVKFGW